MTIRPAVLEDVPTLVEMGRHFLADSPYAAVFAHSPEQMTELATKLLTIGDDATVLVVEDAGVLTGMLGLVCAPHFISGERMAGEVFWWVEPHARTSGVRLLKAGEQWARDRGAVAMQMIAPDDHVAGFYERVGYALLERSYVRRLAA